jgi:predicted dehydrogenase
MLDVPHVEDFQSALEDCDVVCVCTDPADRVPTVTAALAAGRHVLVDKPMALSVVDCDAIALAADATGLVCLPAHHWRFHPAVRSAAAAVAAGRVGLPWNVQADFLVAGGPPCSAGELVNFGAYPLDVIQAITGLAVVDAYAIEASDGFTVLYLTYEHGMTATVTVGRGPELDGGPGMGLHRYRISGSHGVLTVDASKPGFTVRNAQIRRTDWVGGSTVDALVAHFHDAVTTGKPAAIGPADARAAANVLAAAKRSIAVGRPEPLEAGR